jgi:hypothetical protein
MDSLFGHHQPVVAMLSWCAIRALQSGVISWSPALAGDLRPT